MCRSIQPLFNFEPPATEEDIRAAALQFVRKISGFNRPSKVNEAAFNAAVDAITTASTQLFNKLETTAPLRNRAEMKQRAKKLAVLRFSSPNERKIE
ncbi:MAG: DUF2277 domain-containing protein [Anaerolineaceae bacterium]|nr:DUF2277 domain-containing protein [Anaerolineaceae bacterium]